MSLIAYHKVCAVSIIRKVLDRLKYYYFSDSLLNEKMVSECTNQLACSGSVIDDETIGQSELTLSKNNIEFYAHALNSNIVVLQALVCMNNYPH